MTIGILFALEVEASHFTEQLNITSEIHECGVTLRRGAIGGCDIIVSVFGVGSVSAAAAAQLLISKYGCCALLNAGAAGRISAPVSIGDLVLCDSVSYHDFDSGILKGYPPFLESFPTDRRLLDAAADYCARFAISHTVGGAATGNAFVCSAAHAREIYSRTGCVCVDMESAGIAQTAARSGVAFFAAKVITDLADESVAELKTVKDMPYEQHAKVYCSLLLDLVQKISAGGLLRE